jgi:tripartite-type tricarboxylate transporter receptor subunit TctC
MTTFKRRLALLTACMALANLFMPAAHAQTAAYPDKPVRIIVPFPPGGAADIFARLIGQKYGELWSGKQAVVIDNRAGASGIIGSEAAAKSAPDGYTLLMVTIGHAVNPYMFAKLPYDTKKDFTPIGVIANVPSLVVAGPSAEGKTFKDFMANAKAKPGMVKFASSGAGTTRHAARAVQGRGTCPARRDGRAGRHVCRHYFVVIATGAKQQAARPGHYQRQALAAAARRAYGG